MTGNFDRIECMGWKDFGRLNTGRVWLHIDALDTLEFYHLYATSLNGRHWDGIAVMREHDQAGNMFWVLTVWEQGNHKTSAIGRWGELVDAARELLVALHQLVNGPHDFNLVADWYTGPLPFQNVQ